MQDQGHEVLRKGRGHHPPFPWVVSDEAAGGRQARNPASLCAHWHSGLVSCRAVIPQKFIRRHKLGTDHTGSSGTHMHT